MVLSGDVSHWSLFVLYPNKEPVCRELPVPQSLAELREALQVFDDQHLLVADPGTGNGGESSAPVSFAFVERVDQLCDGAVLRVTVPRRCIFINLDDSVRNKPVAWYPGASAEQIENAIVKACGLPLGTPIELMDGDTAVVISATIPNDASLSVVPIESVRAESVRANGSVRQENPRGKRRDQDREVQNSHTPTVGRDRATSAPRASPASRQNSAVQRPVRSPTPLGSIVPQQTPQGICTSGSAESGARSRVNTGANAPGRATSPVRDPSIPTNLAAVPLGKVSGPDEHCIHVLAGHAGFVLCLCTVGDVLFTGSQDCNIMIWDLNSLQYIGTLPGHQGFVKCMVATIARKALCSGSQDRTIKVWSLESFSSTKTLVGHTSEVNALTILESSDVLISGGEDKSVRVWDLSQLVLLTSLDMAHTSGVFALGKLDDSMFISASRDRTMKIWTASTWQARRTLAPPHYDGVSDLAVGAKSGRFFSASRDRSIRRWNARTFESDLQLTHAHGDWLTSLALSPSEEMLYSGSKDCVIKVWDAGLHCKDLLLGHRGPISSLLTVDGHLFSASHDRTVRVWRVDHFEGQS